jgi:branched-chain amino acid transport system substrate-binding protein
VVIGHLCTHAAIPASEVYETARIPLITLATNPLVTSRGLHWTFSGSPPDDATARFTAEYIVQQLAAKRIAILHDTRAYGKGLAELTRKSLEQLGKPPVVFEAVQPEQLLFAESIERLRLAAADALYYGGYPGEGGLLRRQMAEAGFLPPMIMAGANSSETYGLIAGPAANGTLVIFDRPLDTPEFARFEATLRATYRIEPDLRVTRTYSNAKIWAQAAEAAGSIDGTAVARALHFNKFHVFGIDARFDDRGNVQGPLGEATVWIWQGGKPVPLPSAASAEIGVKP